MLICFVENDILNMTVKVIIVIIKTNKTANDSFTFSGSLVIMKNYHLTQIKMTNHPMANDSDILVRFGLLIVDDAYDDCFNEDLMSMTS